MWWTITILLVALLAGVIFWLYQRKIRVSWYAALLALLGLLLLVFALNNSTNFSAEHESTAAWNTFFVLGLPGIALMLLAAFLVWWREFKKARVRQAPDTVAG